MPASSMRGSFATWRAVSTRWTLRAQADSLSAGCGLGAHGKLESKSCLVEVLRHAEDPGIQELVSIPQTASADDISFLLGPSAL